MSAAQDRAKDIASIEFDLAAVLRGIGPLAVAVSGGVDSMTLAHVAHESVEGAAEMIHAISAAVPGAATERVRRHATTHGWRLREIDAGEFADPRYRANPSNRCFFCKTNLYGTMAGLTDSVLVSGTNLDDLGDWRPGLRAASDHGVRHPFVEAGIDKKTVRAIAHARGLDDLAELPAAPCLSSRVETGLRVEPAALAAIDRAESALRQSLKSQTVRCRVIADGIRVELDQHCLEGLGADELTDIRQITAQCFGEVDPAEIDVAPYRRGSAFLR